MAAAAGSRPYAALLAKRLFEPRRFIIAITGSRQVGKTTLVEQVVAESDLLVRYATADEPSLKTRVDKPALFRRVFELGCSFSAQILSYTKMLGQLQDAGNTTTLSHYRRKHEVTASSGAA